MDRIKTLIREPALLIDLAETLVVLAVAFGIHLSNTQETNIIAAIVAALGLGKAFMVHPFAPGVIVDFGRAALMLGVSFGLNVTADQSALIITALGTLTTIVLTTRVTPVNDPVIAAQGAGAGPVAGRTEAGYAALEVVGIVLMVLAVLGMIGIALSAFKVVALVWLIILFIVGLGCFFFGRRTV